jgi:hypothetical protein
MGMYEQGVNKENSCECCDPVHLGAQMFILFPFVVEKKVSKTNKKERPVVFLPSFAVFQIDQTNI